MCAVTDWGYVQIRGRVDDVINVSGHRMSTAEIESALILHPGVAETAVVGIADEMSGQAICSFVCMKPDYKSNDEGSLIKELTMQVRKNIGPFAAPKSEWDSEVLTKLTVCCQKSTS